MTNRKECDKITVYGTAGSFLVEHMEGMPMETENVWEKNNALAKTARETDKLPPFHTAAGTEDAPYWCGDGGYEVTVRGVTPAEVDAYVSDLQAAGFEPYTDNVIGESRFFTLRKKTRTVFVCHHAKIALCRILSEKATGYLPPLTELPAEGPLTTVPTLTQIGRRGARTLAPGMSFILQLADGSYILMDGGPFDDYDTEELYRFLVRNKPANHKKPIIAAWIISHAHGDHMQLPTDFLAKHSKDVVIRLGAGNFPDFSCDGFTYNAQYDLILSTRFREQVRANNPKAKFWNFHTGQKLLLPGGAELEIFCTHEDEYPVPFYSTNHTSSAWRIRASGKTMLFLGDCEKQLCKFMADAYGDALKTDCLQLAHHGFNGAVPEINWYANPSTCFWAMDEDRFLHDPRTLGTDVTTLHFHSNYLFNRYLRDDAVIPRCHYHSGVTVSIPLAFPE